MNGEFNDLQWAKKVLLAILGGLKILEDLEKNEKEKDKKIKKEGNFGYIKFKTEETKSGYKLFIDIIPERLKENLSLPIANDVYFENLLKDIIKNSRLIVENDRIKIKTNNRYPQTFSMEFTLDEFGLNKEYLCLEKIEFYPKPEYFGYKIFIPKLPF